MVNITVAGNECRFSILITSYGFSGAECNNVEIVRISQIPKI